MISLICTHCQTQLMIDDAFAGGVCRCQHCGTIQTVPARGDAVAAGAAKAVPGGTAGGTGRSLYRTQTRDVPASDSTGGSETLEQLADVVASSGLSGSGLAGSGLSSLRSKRKSSVGAASGSTGSVNPAGNRTALLIALATALVIAIGVCVWLAMRSSSAPSLANGTPGTNSSGSADTSTVAPSGGGASPTVTAPGTPQFCGITLTGSSVVYLLDRGNSASEIFDALKQATYASIKSLGNERKFQVVLWDNHTGDLSYPPSEPTFATPDNLSACMKVLDDVTAFNQSEITTPLKKVVAEAPDEIVIVTAKGFELDDSFTAAVEGITKDSKIKIDTISLRGSDCPPLKAVAKAGGGTYAAVTDGALRAAAPPQ